MKKRRDQSPRSSGTRRTRQRSSASETGASSVKATTPAVSALRSLSDALGELVRKERETAAKKEGSESYPQSDANKKPRAKKHESDAKRETSGSYWLSIDETVPNPAYRDRDYAPRFKVVEHRLILRGASAALPERAATMSSDTSDENQIDIEVIQFCLNRINMDLVETRESIQQTLKQASAKDE